MIYAKAFFDLQLGFATKIAALSARPLVDVLLEYTNLYIRFGLGRGFDPAHPGWREYLASLPGADELGEWTYRFYLSRAGATTGPAVAATVGCFSYARLEGDRIRLHFHNAETDDHPPLAVDRADQRRAELAALLAHATRTLPKPPTVVGTSWLYNLAAYRRLFPASYLDTARVIAGRFRHMPLWGQFLDRRGMVKEALAHQFLERLQSQSSLDGLDRCFPLRVLFLEAPIQDFNDFYDRRAPGLGAARLGAE